MQGAKSNVTLAHQPIKLIQPRRSWGGKCGSSQRWAREIQHRLNLFRINLFVFVRLMVDTIDYSILAVNVSFALNCASILPRVCADSINSCFFLDGCGLISYPELEPVSQIQYRFPCRILQWPLSLVQLGGRIHQSAFMSLAVWLMVWLEDFRFDMPSSITPSLSTAT